MTCKCGSDRILGVDAKCSDQCGLHYKHLQLYDYPPSNLGIGGGDYLSFKLCLNCGVIQNFASPCERDVLKTMNGEDH